MAVGTDSPLSSGLRIDEREIDGVWVLSAVGELDLAAAPQLCASVDAARAAGHRLVLLDLTELAFCDSCGLRALHGAVDEIVGASEFLPLQPDVEAGLAALKPLGRLATTE